MSLALNNWAQLDNMKVWLERDAVVEQLEYLMIRVLKVVGLSLAQSTD